MRTTIIISVYLTLLVSLTFGQANRDDILQEIRQKPTRKHDFLQERSHQENRPNQQDLRQLPQIKNNMIKAEHLDERIPSSNNYSYQKKSRIETLNSQKLPSRKHSKPLIKLIFLLLAALFVITFILLHRIAANIQRQNHIHASNIIRQSQNNNLTSLNLHSALSLDEEIKLQRQRLRQLKKMKYIKQKYLISNFNSNNQIIVCKSISKAQGDLPLTPVFVTPFTFRKCQNP